MFHCVASYIVLLTINEFAIMFFSSHCNNIGYTICTCKESNRIDTHQSNFNIIRKITNRFPFIFSFSSNYYREAIILLQRSWTNRFLSTASSESSTQIKFATFNGNIISSFMNLSIFSLIEIYSISLLLYHLYKYHN